MTFTTPLPPAPEAIAAVRVRGVIDLDIAGPRISRHVYGHFAEHLGRCIYGGFFVGAESSIPNEGGIRLDVVEALRALNIPNLRWPGGCFADEYHWTDGLGPRDERPTMVNSHWGDVVEDNSFGTHEFMALCELLDTAPYISANVGSGTVREASEWIEYLTRADDSPMARLRRTNGRDKPWSVPFWGLGNEPWGCGGRFSPEAYAQLAKTFGTYSREHNGNAVYRIAAGGSSDDYVWTDVLMRTLGFRLGAGHPEKEPDRPFEAISFHHYTVPGPWERKGSATVFTVDDYHRTLREAVRIETILAGHSAVMDAYDPGKTIGLVLDEWGTWFDVEPGTNPGFLFQQNTMRDAIVAGIHFDAFHRHADRLVMANIAQTVNVLQAMILTDGEAMVLTPTYHVFEMNKGHQDADSLAVSLVDAAPVIDVEGTDVETLSISASRSGDSVLISATNADTARAVTLELDLRGAVVASAVARILTAETLGAHNSPSSADTVAPRVHEGAAVADGILHISIPAHSFVTVTIAVVP